MYNLLRRAFHVSSKCQKIFVFLNGGGEHWQAYYTLNNCQSSQLLDGKGAVIIVKQEGMRAGFDNHEGGYASIATRIVT